MGLVAAGTSVAFGSAMVLLALFFRTKNEQFDRVAEWLFVVFGILAVPTILTVAGRMGAIGQEPVGIALTAVGAIGVGVLALSELGAALKLVDFRKIAGLTTVGFLAFLVWIGGVSVAILATPGSVFPAALGWLGVVSIVLGIAVVAWITRTPGVLTGQVEPDPGLMSFFFVPLAGMVVWMIWLGLSL